LAEVDDLKAQATRAVDLAGVVAVQRAVIQELCLALTPEEQQATDEILAEIDVTLAVIAGLARDNN
jgi:hypothetical protein